jgi:minor extracellular serine protease Vpr
VSPSQVNVQVPWELAGQTSAVIKVNISETTGQTYTLPLAAYSPAFFEFPLNGQSLLAARDTSFNLITPAHPAIRGQVVLLYANGLGPVTNQPANGDVAPANPLAETKSIPQVTIGGQPATVEFHGLAPGYTGLYQLNVDVPAGTSPGLQPVVVTIGGVASPAANLPVQ